MTEFAPQVSILSKPFNIAQQIQYAPWRLYVTLDSTAWRLKTFDPLAQEQPYTTKKDETTTFIKDEFGKLWYFDAVIKVCILNLALYSRRICVQFRHPPLSNLM